MGPLHLALSPAVLSQLRQRGTSDFCQFCSAGFLPPLIPPIFLSFPLYSFVAPSGFFPSQSVIFLTTCSSSSPQRVLMSLRNGVDMSAVLVLTSSSTFYLPSSFGRPVSEILAITGHISSFIGGSLLYPAADHVPGDLFILLPPPLSS